jgi:hypothetical protein
MSLFKISPKTLVLGGIAIAAAAGALKNRDKVAGLIGARSSAPEPPRPDPAPAPRPAGPSNYDAAGPVANTATAVPAPESTVLDQDGGIDERAEEEAAAAEAAAIGGPTPEYPGLSIDEKGDEATRPLEEAGEGESEGEELAEFDMVDEAESHAGDPSDAEFEIDAAIEAQDNPALGESDEALSTQAVDDDEDGPSSTAKDDETSASNGSGEASQATFGFAGGKVAEPEEGAGAGLPDETAAAAAVAEAAEEEEEGPEIHPDQTSLLEGADDDADGEPEEKGKGKGKGKAKAEKPAAEKSSAVWEPPKSPDASGDDDDDGGGDDDGGSEWQTWSGRAVK